MKALNSSRWVTVKYPRNTPRISRKKLWMDRSEWRKSPGTVYEGGTAGIDRAMEGGRSGGSLEQTNYEGFADLMDRAGRVGIKRF
jgi:hypothetical protein